MNEEELENILDGIGGLGQSHENTPATIITKKPQPLVKSPTKIVADKLAPKITTTARSPTEQITRVKEATVITASEKVITKKRPRKTNQKRLAEKAKLHHGELMGEKYTSTRLRKVLIQLNKLIYTDMKNYQIMEFLLLQSLAQNQALLPPNYKDLID